MIDVVQPFSNGLSEYIFTAKYSRYLPWKMRRETWDEAVNRVRDMHLHHFRGARIYELIRETFEAVRRKEVLPSMRALQFGGEAILKNHCRQYNCASMHMARARAFAEYFYLLLCGCGVGVSIQKQHIAKLPVIRSAGYNMDSLVKTHVVEDTIEGWAYAVDELFNSFFNGVEHVRFDYSLIRPEGSILKTSGGRAPGPEPLKKAIEQCRKILRGAIGRKLRSIEIYDCMMHLAEAVLSGGIRRAATIVLFSADDADMVTAKTADNYNPRTGLNKQRSNSNNSVALLRNNTEKETYRSIFDIQKQLGEPGVVWLDDLNYTINPCAEIVKYPYIEETEEHGVQFCNLTTINMATCKNEYEFYERCRYAAIIGTLQAAYTDFPFLTPASKIITEREALLGVSMCGIMDNPKIALHGEILQTGARIVLNINEEIAGIIGINPCARGTCVKPDGTTSLFLGAIGSGVHPHHAPHSFRLVQANRNEPHLKYFKEINPHLVEPSVWRETDDVITFRVKAPNGAVFRDDVTGVNFLEAVRIVQENWVIPGRRHTEYVNAHHNVSNTVTVKDHEWDEVFEYMWENKDKFTAVSMLPYTGDKDYPQAPRQAVVTQDDWNKWNQLEYRKVDYTQMIEHTDNTSLKDAAACLGGYCEL